MKIRIEVDLKYSIGDILFLKQTNNGGKLKVKIVGLELALQYDGFHWIKGYYYILNKPFNGRRKYRTTEWAIDRGFIYAR